jgi:hypothetical protein
LPGGFAAGPGKAGDFDLGEARIALYEARSRLQKVLDGLASIRDDTGAVVTDVRLQAGELDRLLGQIAH